jgi:hypothetical protein
MRLMELAALLWMAAAASAQDALLAGLDATLTTLHAHAADTPVANFGARPELTVAKHQLRDWIETQLDGLKDFDDIRTFSDRINKALEAVGVGAGDDPNLLGSLGEVRFSADSGFLIVTTGLGIFCQWDESAYAYQKSGNKWRRIWESEQNDYSESKYAPQHISEVHVARYFGPRGEEGSPYLMTLGHQDWCTSNWHPIYYRVWRIDPSGPNLVLDGGSGWTFEPHDWSAASIASRWTPQGGVTADVLVEFTQDGLKSGFTRQAVRHYFIEGDRVRRVDPVALGPHDFVDEWLTRPWSESASWSAVPALANWHKRLTGSAGEFDGSTRHCQTPDLWQIALSPTDLKTNLSPHPDVYFLVRWRPPYRFTMVNISAKPWARCTEKDPEADEQRTLFNDRLPR